MAEAFEPADFDLVSYGLSLFPELELAVYVAKKAKEKLSFPLNAPEQLLPLLEEPARKLVFKGRELDEKDLEQYMLKDYFPIADAPDLVGKVLFGLVRGANLHALRAKHRILRDSSFAENIILTSLNTP